MGLRAGFSPLNSNDSFQERNNADVASAVRSLARCVPQDFDDVRTFKSVSLSSAAATEIKHGLGRQPRGWIVAGLRQTSGTPGVVYEASSAYPNGDRATTLRLSLTSGSVTCSLYVY